MMIENIKRISVLLVAIFAITTNVIADEADDKEEFDILYAQFNDLYANSEELDPIIEVAEKLYKFAPKVYGKNHKNTATVTYNLATLYDVEGAETNSREEKKALKLYEKYFEILDRSKTVTDLDYLKQYLKYVRTYYNVRGRRGSNRPATKFKELLIESDLPSIQIAAFQYEVACIEINRERLRYAEDPLLGALLRYQEKAENYPNKIAEIEYLLGSIAVNNKDFDSADKRYNTVLKIYDDNLIEPDQIYKSSLIYLGNIHFQKNWKSQKSYEFTKRFIDLEVPEVTRTDVTKYGIDEYLPTVRANPLYPIEAVNQGLDAFVIVLFDVDENGETIDPCAIASSNKLFSQYAVNAVKQYKYKPVVVDGNPIKVDNVIVRIEFIIHP